MKRLIAVALFLSSLYAFGAATPSYVSDETQWAALQPLKEITGLVRPANWKEQVVWADIDILPSLPENYDWQEQAKTLGMCWTDVRNQGNCGSCWAWASRISVELALALKTPLANGCKLLSPQEELSCSRAGSCRGGFFALDYDKNHGAGLEADFPYAARDLRCKQLDPVAKVMQWQYIKSTNVDKIKSAIFVHGPIPVTVTANGAMQSYRGGLFNGCSNGGTNHMVIIQGWKQVNGKVYWRMRNSWGKPWGEDGSMWIPAGCSRIGEDAAFLDLQ